MNKRKWVIVLGGLGIIIFAVVSMNLLGSLKPVPQKTPAKEIVRFVKAKPVQYKNTTTVVEAKGRVKSKAEVVISAEAAGEVLEGEVPFKTGQKFKKGDLLAKIYDTNAVLLLKSQKSSFLNIVANVLPDFKITYTESYDRWYSFFENININKDLPDLPEIKSTQEKVLLASRNLLTTYYSIKSQEIVLKRYNIYAPFNGTISNVTMQVGAVVNKGAKLGEIINTQDMELEVPVELDDAKWINEGDAVEVLNESYSNSWKGKIVRKSQNVDPQTQSVVVYVALKSSQANPLYKGQYLTAQFSGIKLSNVMELPRKAVFNSNVVFVVKDSLLAKQEIKIKKINRNTLFFNGLNENTMIVVEPLINVTENTKVRILGENSETDKAANTSSVAGN